MYCPLTLNGYSNFINAVKRQRNLGLVLKYIPVSLTHQDASTKYRKVWPQGPFTDKYKNLFEIAVKFSDLTNNDDKLIISFIFSIYTLFEPQIIIWAPIYKKCWAGVCLIF